MGVTTYYSAGGELLGHRTDVGAAYGTDALGSVTVTAIDDQQRTPTNYYYKPYGSRLNKLGNNADPRYLWNGTSGYRETAISHSKSYVRARHLGQEEGRWTTVDPLWPGELSYTYVFSNPVTKNDWNGLSSIVVIDIPPWLPRAMNCGIKAIGSQPPLGLRRCPPLGTGNCPHQNATGDMIDLAGFDKGDSSKGKPGQRQFDQTRCNASDDGFNWAAFEARYQEVLSIYNSNCPPKGGGNSDVGVVPRVPWAMTIPCWDLVGGKYLTTCSIRCMAELFGMVAALFGRNGGTKYEGGSTVGSGCVVKCMMEHEMEHCDQAKSGQSNLGSPENECAGWARELKCLEKIRNSRIKKGY